MDAVNKKRANPAKTSEQREQQLINLAYNEAEKRLANSTASSQVVTHFLKLGSQRAKLELERIRQENLLLQAKTEAIQSGKRVEELYTKALEAMRRYTGETIPDEEFDD